jgi:hypothetical protein
MPTSWFSTNDPDWNAEQPVSEWPYTLLLDLHRLLEKIACEGSRPQRAYVRWMIERLTQITLMPKAEIRRRQARR